MQKYGIKLNGRTTDKKAQMKRKDISKYPAFLEGYKALFPCASFLNHGVGPIREVGNGVVMTSRYISPVPTRMV